MKIISIAVAKVKIDKEGLLDIVKTINVTTEKTDRGALASRESEQLIAQLSNKKMKPDTLFERPDIIINFYLKRVGSYLFIFSTDVPFDLKDKNEKIDLHFKDLREITFSQKNQKYPNFAEFGKKIADETYVASKTAQIIQVTLETKKIMNDNIEKIIERSGSIEALVDKTGEMTEMAFAHNSFKHPKNKPQPFYKKAAKSCCCFFSSCCGPREKPEKPEKHEYQRLGRNRSSIN
jgi:hypothetical protein